MDHSVSSVAQLCLILCDSWNDCSMPGFSVHHQLPELAQTPVHPVSDAIQPSHLCRPFLLLPSIFPSIRVFSNESVLWSGGESIGTSASASSSMNIQDWFPLELTGLILWIIKSPKEYLKMIWYGSFGCAYSVILLEFYCYFITTNILFDSFRVWTGLGTICCFVQPRCLNI